MAFTHSFTAVTPPPRFDNVAWVSVQIEQGAASTGPWTQVASTAIPVDATPSTPDPVDLTVTTATLEQGFFRFRFTDGVGNTSPWTRAVLSPGGVAYITVGQMRTRYPELTVVKYADALVVEAIDLATEAFEQAADVAFSPRTSTLTLSSTDGSSLNVPVARVTGVTAASSTNGTIDVTRSRLIAGSYLTGYWPTSENITVTVTHGYTVTPLRVIRAVMLLARTWLVRGPVDDRATQIPSADGGVINLSTPGVFGATFGIPEVDATLAEYRHDALVL